MESINKRIPRKIKKWKKKFYHGATMRERRAKTIQMTIPSQIETLLYGCKIGQPDYMEEILYQCKGYVNKEEVMNHGKEWAAKNGYDRLRISVVDLSIPPDFTKTINIQK